MEFYNKELFGKMGLSLHIKQAYYLFYFILSYFIHSLLKVDPLLSYDQIYKNTQINGY